MTGIPEAPHPFDLSTTGLAKGVPAYQGQPAFTPWEVHFGSPSTNRNGNLTLQNGPLKIEGTHGSVTRMNFGGKEIVVNPDTVKVMTDANLLIRAGSTPPDGLAHAARTLTGSAESFLARFGKALPGVALAVGVGAGAVALAGGASPAEAAEHIPVIGAAANGQGREAGFQAVEQTGLGYPVAQAGRMANDALRMTGGGNPDLAPSLPTAVATTLVDTGRAIGDKVADKMGIGTSTTPDSHSVITGACAPADAPDNQMSRMPMARAGSRPPARTAMPAGTDSQAASANGPKLDLKNWDAKKQGPNAAPTTVKATPIAMKRMTAPSPMG